MKFFAGYAKNFMDMEVKPMQPYRSGSWPCFNSLCAHYKEDVAERTDKYRRLKPDQSFEEYLLISEKLGIDTRTIVEYA